MLRITHNTAISALRRRRDDVIAPDELPERPGHGSVEESALLQADRDEVWRALSRLDPVSAAGRAIARYLKIGDHVTVGEVSGVIAARQPTVVVVESEVGSVAVWDSVLHDGPLTFERATPGSRAGEPPRA